MWNVGNHDQAIEEMAVELARMPVFRYGAGLCEETVLAAMVRKVLRENNLRTTEQNVEKALDVTMHFLTQFDMTPNKFVGIVLYRCMEGI